MLVHLAEYLGLALGCCVIVASGLVCTCVMISMPRQYRRPDGLALQRARMLMVCPFIIFSYPGHTISGTTLMPNFLPYFYQISALGISFQSPSTYMYISYTCT
jgi:hypothetical protein